MQQAEGGKTPQEDLSLPLQYHRRETGAKNTAKMRREKIQMLGVSGRKNKKRLSSAKFQQKGSRFGRLACKTFPHILEGKKKKKEEKMKKDSHQKTQASCTSQQAIYNGSHQRTIQSRSFSCLPLLFGMGPY